MREPRHELHCWRKAVSSASCVLEAIKNGEWRSRVCKTHTGTQGLGLGLQKFYQNLVVKMSRSKTAQTLESSRTANVAVAISPALMSDCVVHGDSQSELDDMGIE
jgi:hypothetical protein